VDRAGRADLILPGLGSCTRSLSRTKTSGSGRAANGDSGAHITTSILRPRSAEGCPVPSSAARWRIAVPAPRPGRSRPPASLPGPAPRLDHHSATIPWATSVFFQPPARSVRRPLGPSPPGVDRGSCSPPGFVFRSPGAQAFARLPRSRPAAGLVFLSQPHLPPGGDPPFPRTKPRNTHERPSIPTGPSLQTADEWGLVNAPKPYWQCCDAPTPQFGISRLRRTRAYQHDVVAGAPSGPSPPPSP